MRCEHVQQQLTDQRYAGQPGEAAVEAHLATCAACRAFAARSEQLDRLLAADSDAPARPGFDTRFFARLEALKQQQRAPKQRWWSMRWLWLALPVAASAAVALFLMMRSAGAPLSPTELQFAMNLELLENYDVVRQLDELEAFELLAELDQPTLDRLLKEESL